MSTAKLAPPRVSRGEQRFRISGVPWKSYVLLGQAFAERHSRITYDRGELELMTTSFAHEVDKKLLGRMVGTLTLELNIDIASGGSTTLFREDLECGLEGDEIWWIQHEAQVRALRQIDLHRDPPPDLALEVEISHSTLNRMGIYAALKVPEVWRWDGQDICVWRLNKDGAYVVSERSLAFPFLPAAELGRFMLMASAKGQTEVARAFHKWVMEHLDEWKASDASKKRRGDASKKRNASPRRR